MIPVSEYLKKVKSIYNMILFPYILLALPFALMGAILALRGMPSFYQIFWILMA
ncbi:4-hydroxybenzoate octaprenyltransferase, partial [Candidatus Poribacteria bacterium]|nr:4-hydroxybenzoate octaprenyltransferase [Candidatus Poribacteria bacterium]